MSPPISFRLNTAIRCFFFFQAEDGIRDVAVTGVQTCALPILGEVVELGSSIVQDMARRAQIDFRSEIEAPLPPMIGDPAKLTQILVNLLSNAIKFTAPGGKVRLKVERPAHRGITLRVEDTGIGMAADQIPIALAPFGQIESNLTRKHDGVGLGLPLTKRLVELHGGTIEIDSEPGKGTVVSAHLPEARLCRESRALAV